MTDNTEINEIALEEETNVNTPEQEETLNPEPEIIEEQRIPEPWENAPDNMIYPDNIDQETGRLGSYTLSAEMAYRLGTFENGIPLSEVEFSDIDDWPYLKDKCPHKTQEMKDRDNAIQEITQLKKQLSNTDYKAIKFAEGQLTEEEYSATRSQRASWRARINKLQEDFNI